MKVEEKISELRKLRKWKNLIEMKRIDIAIALLQGKKYKEIKKELNCWESKISYVKKTYSKDKEFYKTNYKWAKERYGDDLEKVLDLIKEWKENNKWFDLREIVEKLWLERNKKSYNKVWYLTRRKGKMLYQKPYVIDKKSPDNADEILKKKHKGIFIWG